MDLQLEGRAFYIVCCPCMHLPYAAAAVTQACPRSRTPSCGATQTSCTPPRSRPLPASGWTAPAPPPRYAPAQQPPVFHPTHGLALYIMDWL